MNLRDQLREYGVTLRSYTEGDHKTLCPKCSKDRKHHKDPCLSVTIDDKGAVWKCHHCNDSGGIIDRADDLRPIPKRKSQAIDPTKLRSLTADQISWFKSRGIESETLRLAKVGSASPYIPAANGQCEAIAFPYFRGDKIVNVKFRTAAKQFSQVKGAEKILYGLERLDMTVHDVVIVEGEPDALACTEAGIANALSVPDGAPRKVKEGEIDPTDDKKFDYLRNCEDDLKPFKRIILAVDNDEPGKALAEELARRIGRDRCWLVDWPEGCKDANDVLLKCGPDDLAACIAAARPYPIKNVYGVSHYAEAVLQLYREGRRRGLSTGWCAVDEFYTVRPGELTVVTGIPNSGKSEWVDAVVMNIAQREGWRFGMCSFENQPEQHLSKLAEKFTIAPFWDGPTSRMGEGDLRRALEWLNEFFYFIRSEDESPTIDWLLDAARATVLRYGIRGLIIDPFNELEHRRPSGQSETEYVSDMLAKVKRFAQNHGVHVWFIAHPRKMERGADGKVTTPGLYDISGSAHWANKADVGIAVVRDDEHQSAHIDVLKVRFKEIGRKGTATLRYDRVTGCYTEIEKRPIDLSTFRPKQSDPKDDHPSYRDVKRAAKEARDGTLGYKESP